MEWQPIETAPKDGTPVLLFEWRGDPWEEPEANIFVGEWDHHRDGELYKTQWVCTEYEAFNHNPTHWMPLPPPPKDD